MFSIPLEEKQNLMIWIKKQYNLVAKQQNSKYPNYGAISGGYTYSFIPTNIGSFITVTNNITKQQYNIQDI
jgi:hypothetical protein